MLEKQLKPKVVELYNGEVKIEFEPERHRYTNNSGEKVTSVTQALNIINKPALLPWACRVMADELIDNLNKGEVVTQDDIKNAKSAHRRIKNKAADIGTEVHKWAEEYIKGNNPELPEDEQVLNGVTAFLKWVDAHSVKFKSSERIVYSKKYNYVGTMDAEAYIDGQLCVIDFKTSSNIWPEMLLQTAAYQAAAEEEDNSKFEGDRWIARFDRDTGEFEAKQFGEYKKHLQAFLSAHKLSSLYSTIKTK